ncbi:gluconokinase [Sinorhizobium medicae]|uniref:Gluconokinase n=1 Tax=Sinorhizobium medicae (strain WSM419) TaxID=366394 RepID=A6UI51_SINMW|nr:gluconokinase [Sinorhizobium medicae]ABR63331.1 carbohydrate kinase, thermoresistant glucokinase family [Sinorhizobium medicae WSM419]MDX0435823.1 AAA family ATPase [Sinorhizobium medicae]MDX0616741.1 AAA family ATPase [Sinorhizobium medicae]MDX0653647.1 AAA family ATPase [Sinorhizobium medicae]MDX0674027.1 AAA family ATPase [Sinorhizobium medicae]
MSVEYKSEPNALRRFPGSIVVMGVSGSGKSSVGEAIAKACGYPFLEGDALHPAENIRKMSEGVPLTDDDRWPWLDAIGERLASREPVVVSCSALRRIYRDKLRESAPRGLAFVFLYGSEAVLSERMQHRTGHFMPSSLLQTQLATLEDPRGEAKTIAVDVAHPLAEIVREALEGLARL